MIKLVLFFACVILSCLPFLHSAATDVNTSRPTCPESFSCPNPKFAPFYYPFYNNATNSTGCGLINVQCTSDGGEIKIGGDSYEILNKFVSESVVVIHNKTFEKLVNESRCEALMNNFTSPSPLLYSISITLFITIFKCANTSNYATQMDAYSPLSDYNNTKCKDHKFYYKYLNSDSTVPNDLPPSCQVIHLPVKLHPSGHQAFNENNIFSLITSEIPISFKLSPSCEHCHNKRHGRCHIQDGRFKCLDAQKQKPGRMLILAIVLVGSSLILFLVIFTIWRCYKTNPLSYVSSNDKSPNVEDGSLVFGVPVFSYSELEDATQNFNPSQELGNGGFGAVFYGKLQDGREVAVKRLYEHNYKRIQQFVNEVQILTSLRHPNLVVLYGCTSRQSHELLLVYEYISNGTVYDHIHGELANQRLLTWPLRMNIAIETARALVYLHASEIIHRDVKTNNILLDQNFNAKVADFGLSRLVPNDVTHVSTAPQGTPGYVDPQYHHRYQLTDKSDVYSFGVVLIELISSMVAVDLNRSQDEISLANLALNRIQRCELDQLIDPVLGSDEDPEVLRMVTSVAELGFRCLQYYSEMRPTINEVLDELEDIQSNGRKDGNMKAPPPPSETSDKAVLLKNFLPSPVSVTGEWYSDSNGSTTLTVT